MSAVGVGALTTGVLAMVDELGNVEQPPVTIGWRVWSRDRWLVPGADVVTRRERPWAAPVVCSALRIPGGEVVHRTYAVGDRDGVIVIEIENASPEAIAVALMIDGADPDVLSLPRPPGAVEPDGALAFPVPHRTALRFALAPEKVDVRALPDHETVTRGWDRLLDRGMRTELPEPLQTEVDAARVDLLLAAASPATFVALEAWGFDAEAITMWSHFGFRERRAVRRVSSGGLLAEIRAALVREAGATVDVLPGFRPAWLGQSLAVHDAPLRRGRCSFALRWHGPRPALLWDVPEGMTIRASALAPAFSSTAPTGETLLAEPPSPLLAMGERAPVGGVRIDEPEQFS